MPKLKPVYHAATNEQLGYRYNCPGCKQYHAVTVQPNTNQQGKSWVWNGSLDTPSFNPVIRVETITNVFCEAYIAEGVAHFTENSAYRPNEKLTLPEI